MTKYDFTVVLQGEGENEAEAAGNAVDMFCTDPGDIGAGIIQSESGPVDKIVVEVRGGVAYCDDDRVEIVDYDNH